MHTRFVPYIAATLILIFLVAAKTYANQVFSPDSPQWKFEGKQVTNARVDGRNAIKIRTGRAMLEGIEFENGLVEFDVYLPQERAFTYLYFRGQSDDDVEAFYLRTHKSKAPDAIQYAPVFQGMSAWQLYHGETGTAAASFPAKSWFSVKIELLGQQMKIWVNDSEKPVLHVKQLGRKSQKGWLAFRGFVPRTSDAEFSGYFSHLKITPYMDKVIPAELPAQLDTGQITQWRVSPAFQAKPGPILTVPTDLQANKWTTPEMRYDGAFEFLRSRTTPDDARHWSVAADVTLVATQDTICQVNFGFSDELTLLVNNRPVLYQDASYRFIDRRQQGVMHAEQVSAYLKLNKGENNVRAIVSDRFGGWGLMARMQDCSGVSDR